MLDDQPLTLVTTVFAEMGESHAPYCAVFELMAVKVRVGWGRLRNERGTYALVS